MQEAEKCLGKSSGPTSATQEQPAPRAELPFGSAIIGATMVKMPDTLPLDVVSAGPENLNCLDKQTHIKVEEEVKGCWAETERQLAVRNNSARMKIRVKIRMKVGMKIRINIRRLAPSEMAGTDGDQAGLHPPG